MVFLKVYQHWLCQISPILFQVLDPRPQYHRTQEIPFSSDRKRMEVRARPTNGEHSCFAFKQASSRHATGRSKSVDGSLYFVKGMPEAVLGECNSHIAADGSATKFTEKGKIRVLSQSRRMASSGLRVLAMAYGPSLEDLIFAGVVGMEDPPREGVEDAVHQLHQSGVTVVMVTGDSKETALAIGKRCGIIGSRQCDMEMEIDSNIIDTYPSSHNPFDDLEFGAGGKFERINQTTFLNIKMMFTNLSFPNARSLSQWRTIRCHPSATVG